MTKNEIIPDEYFGIIGKEATRFLKRWTHIKSVWEYDDLFDEGVLIFYEAKRTFDEKKGQFSTHLVHALRNKFLEITRISRIGNEVYFENMDETFIKYLPPDKPTFFKSLSENAQIIIDTLLDAPEGFVSFAQGYHRRMKYKPMLCQYFNISRKELGKVEKEIKEKILY